MLSGNRLFATILLVLAVVCAVMSIFYFSVDTGFLADDIGRHIKHGFAFGGAAVVFLLAGVVLGRRSKSVSSSV